MAYPILAPQDTWYKSSNAKSTITEINIVDSYTPNGTENENWNADVNNSGSITCYRKGTVLTIAGNGSGKIAFDADSSKVFYQFTGLTTITGLDLIDTSNATTFARMFQDCSKLTALNLNSWDTSNVTDMTATFNGMSKLTSLNINNWDVSNVELMAGMFQVSVSLIELNLSGWDTGKVTSMMHMFSSLTSYGAMALTNIIGIGDLDVSSVTDMSHMFQLCTNITNLDISNWDVSNVTTMRSMFNGASAISSLDVSNWDTSNVTNMQAMFQNASAISSLDVSNWDVSNVTNMSHMFQRNNGEAAPFYIALDVSKWDTSSCTDMSFMFYACNHISTIDVSNWDVSKVTTFDHMFAHSVMTLIGAENWAVSSACTNMNAMFLSTKNIVYDVSKYDTSNVTIFDQMFQHCTNAEKIIGLENFDTSSGLGFAEMFLECRKLKELDLSSFDTSKAKDGAVASANGSYTVTMSKMFHNTYCLEKITLGDKFSFNGDGTTADTSHHAVLPTPSSTYIEGADGKWYTITSEEYTPADIPSNVARTYYASKDIVDNLEVMVKNGHLINISNSIRSKNNENIKYKIREMSEAINSIETVNDFINAEEVQY